MKHRTLAHAQNVPVLLDGAQAIPHMKVDVQALDVDFYTFSGQSKEMFPDPKTDFFPLLLSQIHLEATVTMTVNIQTIFPPVPFQVFRESFEVVQKAV